MSFQPQNKTKTSYSNNFLETCESRQDHFHYYRKPVQVNYDQTQIVTFYRISVHKTHLLDAGSSPVQWIAESRSCIFSRLHFKWSELLQFQKGMHGDTTVEELRDVRCLVSNFN